MDEEVKARKQWEFKGGETRGKSTSGYLLKTTIYLAIIVFEIR
jgi:hypothetical protein